VSAFRLMIFGKVKDGQADAFRELAAGQIEKVKATEPGTNVYNWFIGDDGSFVNEDGYTDAAALLTHLGNGTASGFLDTYMGMVDIERVQVLGTVTDPAAVEALAGFGAITSAQIGSL
jgi:quinol monooxygenase YgiN